MTKIQKMQKIPQLKVLQKERRKKRETNPKKKITKHFQLRRRIIHILQMTIIRVTMKFQGKAKQIK